MKYQVHWHFHRSALASHRLRGSSRPYPHRGPECDGPCPAGYFRTDVHSPWAANHRGRGFAHPCRIADLDGLSQQHARGYGEPDSAAYADVISSPDADSDPYAAAGQEAYFAADRGACAVANACCEAAGGPASRRSVVRRILHQPRSVRNAGAGPLRCRNRFRLGPGLARSRPAGRPLLGTLDARCLAARRPLAFSRHHR